MNKACDSWFPPFNFIAIISQETTVVSLLSSERPYEKADWRVSYEGRPKTCLRNKLWLTECKPEVKHNSQDTIKCSCVPFLPPQSVSYNHSLSLLLTCNKILLDGHNGNLQIGGTVWCLGIQMVIIFIYLRPWSHTYPKITTKETISFCSALKSQWQKRVPSDTWSVLKMVLGHRVLSSLIFYPGWYCLGVQSLSWMSQGKIFFLFPIWLVESDSSYSTEAGELGIFC